MYLIALDFAERHSICVDRRVCEGK